MTDQTNQIKPCSSFLPVAITGVGSSAIGDQIGNALADVLVWAFTQGFHCSIPATVVGAFHTLCVALVVVAAYIIHFKVIKSQQPN